MYKLKPSGVEYIKSLKAKLKYQMNESVQNRKYDPSHNK